MESSAVYRANGTVEFVLQSVADSAGGHIIASLCDLFLPCNVTAAWVMCVAEKERCVRVEVCLQTADATARLLPSDTARVLAGPPATGVRRMREAYPVRRFPSRNVNLELDLELDLAPMPDLLRDTMRRGGIICIHSPLDGTAPPLRRGRLLGAWRAVRAAPVACGEGHLVRFTCEVKGDAAGTRMVGFTAKLSKDFPHDGPLFAALDKAVAKIDPKRATGCISAADCFYSGVISVPIKF
jgi:hypothetical protein